MISDRPRNVDNEWCRWLRQLFHDDCFGMWFPFSLATRYTPEAARAANRQSLFGGSQSSVFRRRPDLTLNHRNKPRSLRFHSSSDIVLQEYSHFHGLFRTPSSAPSTWVPSTIRQNGQPLNIQMPSVLMEMLNLYPRDAMDDTVTPSCLGNLHIDNGGHRAIAMQPRFSRMRKRVLKYWRKRRDGEIREFKEAFFTPHEIGVVSALHSYRNQRTKTDTKKEHKR